MPKRPGVDVDPEHWWDAHERGMGGRPRPGTRVVMRDGRRGAVMPYEGCWKACTFPVLIDYTGQTLMLTTSDVTELVAGGRWHLANHEKPRRVNDGAG